MRITPIDTVRPNVWTCEVAMKSVKRLLPLTMLAFVSSISVLCQTPITAPQPPERVIINFILPIDTNSVNMLLAIINGQMRSGVKKITIVLSSPGGDTAAAFAAYNILKSVPVEITTFNVGNIDSAAMMIYCAGKNRYSFPSPARFLIHGNSVNFGGGVSLDSRSLDSQLQQLNNLNQMTIDVISSTTGNIKRKDIENAVHGQTILSPDDAKQWGIVQEIRDTFMEPGAVFVSVDSPISVPAPKPDSQPTIVSTSVIQ